MKKIAMQAWKVYFDGDNYYIPYTHYIYLEEILGIYDHIFLISPIEKISSVSIDYQKIGQSIEVVALPNYSSYVKSILLFPHFFKVYNKFKKLNSDVDVFYTRSPNPFGWLQKFFFKNKKRIVHYVGDPIDAAKNNPNFSFIKKLLLIKGFTFELYLYVWACKGANVFTNGHHLSERLRRHGINAQPVISSTLTQSDFYYSEKEITAETASFIYLGYLRTAKGIELIVKAFALYNSKYPRSTLKIIGSGELELKLKNYIEEKKIQNVSFLGQIDDRAKVNQELRTADIFLFGSYSEGSPRVILEAMANGLAVISTPVGSLPSVFDDRKEIVFSKFDDTESFLNNMLDLTSDMEFLSNVRAAGYKKAQKFTINNFIRTVFNG